MKINSILFMSRAPLLAIFLVWIYVSHFSTHLGQPVFYVYQRVEWVNGVIDTFVQIHTDDGSVGDGGGGSSSCSSNDDDGNSTTYAIYSDRKLVNCSLDSHCVICFDFRKPHFAAIGFVCVLWFANGLNDFETDKKSLQLAKNIWTFIWAIWTER